MMYEPSPGHLYGVEEFIVFLRDGIGVSDLWVISDKIDLPKNGMIFWHGSE